MRFLGVDPGLLNLGYAIIEKLNSHLHVIDVGTLKTSVKAPLPKRLHQLYISFIQIIEKYHPVIIVVEEPLVKVNPHTSAKVNQVFGLILLASAETQREILTFKPTEWKKALFGYGQISKDSIIKSLKVLLNQSFDDKLTKDEHIVDALSLALLGSVLNEGASRLETKIVVKDSAKCFIK